MLTSVTDEEDTIGEKTPRTTRHSSILFPSSIHLRLLRQYERLSCFTDYIQITQETFLSLSAGKKMIRNDQ